VLLGKKSEPKLSTYPSAASKKQKNMLQVLRVVEIKRKMTIRFYMLRIMPVGLFMALTLHFGNTVYLYLTVSFIQMLKVSNSNSNSSNHQSRKLVAY